MISANMLTGYQTAPETKEGEKKGERYSGRYDPDLPNLEHEYEST